VSCALLTAGMEGRGLGPQGQPNVAGDRDDPQFSSKISVHVASYCKRFHLAKPLNQALY